MDLKNKDKATELLLKRKDLIEFSDALRQISPMDGVGIVYTQRDGPVKETLLTMPELVQMAAVLGMIGIVRQCLIDIDAELKHL